MRIQCILPKFFLLSHGLPEITVISVLSKPSCLYPKLRLNMFALKARENWACFVLVGAGFPDQQQQLLRNMHCDIMLQANILRYIKQVVNCNRTWQSSYKRAQHTLDKVCYALMVYFGLCNIQRETGQLNHQIKLQPQ